MAMTAEQIAAKAAELVSGERDRQHGNMHANFASIAEAVNGILPAIGIITSRPLTSHDVAVLMCGVKIGRMMNGKFNVDDYVDLAGYAACAGEIAGLNAGGQDA